LETKKPLASIMLTTAAHHFSGLGLWRLNASHLLLPTETLQNKTLPM
jgi:hypothetical protein